MYKKIVLFLILLLLSLIYFIASHHFNSYHLSEKEKNFLKYKRTITFVSQTNYAPFEFKNKQGVSSGMTIELIRWMSTQLGFKTKFINTSFYEAQQMILNNNADVITSFFYSKQRDKKFDFTKTVFKIPASIFVNSDNNKIKNFNDLNNKKIAVQKGDYAIDYLKNQHIKYTLVPTKNFLEAADLLVSKKVDAIVADEQIVLFYLIKKGLSSRLKTVGKPLYTGLCSMAVKEGNAVLQSILNKGIKLAQKRKIIDSIESKWLGRHSPEDYSQYIIFFAISLSLLLILLLILWLWNITLKKRINLKTEELMNSLNHQKFLYNNLLTTENKLKKAQSVAKVGSWYLDIVNNKLDWSDETYNIFGIPKKEFINFETFLNSVHPEDKDKVSSAWNEALKGADYRIEHRIIVGDKIKWVEERAEVLFNDKNEPVYGIGTVQDITEKKFLEIELKTNEKKFRTLFESTVDSITLVNFKEKSFADVNKAFSDVTGYAKDEVIGKKISELNIFKDSSMANKILNVIGKQGFFNNFEIEFVTKTGKIIYGLVSASMINLDNIPHILTITRDITNLKNIQKKLKESEETSRAILQALPDLLFIINDKYEFLSCHFASINDLLMPPEEFIGKTVDQVLPPDLSEKTKKHIDNVLKTGKISIFKYKITINNIVKYEEARMVPKSKNEVLAIIRDISSEVQAEEEKIRVSKLESIGVLAGGIAHDFNNILTGIYGNLDILKLKINKEDASYKFLERAFNSLERATALTKQLLTFAKGGEPVLTTIDLRNLITDTVKFNLTGSNIKPVFNIDEDLWNIEADKGQISQVIGNLIINAKQAMPTGGQIYISAKNVSDFRGETDSRHVCIELKDEGIGIPPNHIDKIFDPFFTTKQKGSGLGLSTVHSIITKHNGAVYVDSAYGKGTIFKIFLPAETKSESINHSNSSDNQPELINIKVLLMDDEEMIREVAGEMLEMIGCKVDFAVEGKEAVDKYKTEFENKSPYDIVITDLTIPGGMGGKEAAKLILDFDKNAKLIVASGYSTDPVLANFTQYGFKGQLVKPFKFEELKKEIGKVMEKSS